MKRKSFSRKQKNKDYYNVEAASRCITEKQREFQIVKKRRTLKWERWWYEWHWVNQPKWELLCNTFDPWNVTVIDRI